MAFTLELHSKGSVTTLPFNSRPMAPHLTYPRASNIIDSGPLAIERLRLIETRLANHSVALEDLSAPRHAYASSDPSADQVGADRGDDSYPIGVCRLRDAVEEKVASEVQ